MVRIRLTDQSVFRAHQWVGVHGIAGRYNGSLGTVHLCRVLSDLPVQAVEAGGAAYLEASALSEVFLSQH